MVCKISSVRGQSWLHQGVKMKRLIDPSTWAEFLSEFSERNRGRRARFEAFSRDGVREEDEEAVFDRVSFSNGMATVTRNVIKADGETPIIDEVPEVHGISIQYDSDNSENTMEFMDTNGDMTVLHFESLVDGDS